MRSFLAITAVVLLLAGCSGPAPDPATPPDAPALVATPAEQPIAFSGMDHPYLCPPAGPACVVSGPNPTKTFEFILDNDTSLAGLTLTVDAAGEVNDGRSFSVEVTCSANGGNSCGKGRALLAEAEGPLPLTLEAPGLDVPAGVRVVVFVTGTEVAPSVVNTMQEYVGTGTLDVLRWAPA